MTNLSVLLQDKSIKTRLLIVCVSLSIFVCLIYGVVTYRLTADLLTQNELTAMGKQLEYIHNSLEHKHILPTKGLEIVNWLISKDKGHAYYIEIQEFRGDRLIPKLTRSNLNNQQLNLLHNDLLKTPPTNKGTLALNGKQFLRYSFIGSHFKIEFVKASSSKQLMMTMVARRLLILSAIILWIAIWFALAMSTLIAKRVQAKNDQLTQIATLSLIHI